MSKNYSGTLGYFVKQKNGIGILTNCHVTDGVKTKMSSPSKQDGGTNNDYIGTTKSALTTANVDCAYVPLRGKVTTYKLLDGTSVAGSAAAAVGDHYKYFGRTTYKNTGAAATGTVTSITWTGNVAGKRFTNQIVLSGAVLGGDSGSLLVNRANNNAIGLVFAGSAVSGLANHIGAVQTALGVVIAV